MRFFIGKKIVLATQNEGKIDEFKRILKNSNLKILSAKEFYHSEPEETEDTYVGNALIKSRYCCLKSNLPSLSDDSGLEVRALADQPGVHTADLAMTENGRDFHTAMNILWKKLTETPNKRPYRAKFKCTLALTVPGGFEKIFEGSVNGQIVWPIKGAEGHGFDPIFLPDGHNKTFGEMEYQQKDKISHRNNALKKFLGFYEAQFSQNEF